MFKPEKYYSHKPYSRPTTYRSPQTRLARYTVTPKTRRFLNKLD